MANFADAHKKMRKDEGGYAFVEGDNGGETYAGVTRKNFPKWAGWPIVDQNKPLKHGAVIIDSFLEELLADFYKEHFWDVVGGDEIEDQDTANRLFNFGVTAGQGRSIKQIQEVLNIPITGKVDDETIAAINNPGKYLV